MATSTSTRLVWLPKTLLKSLASITDTLSSTVKFQSLRILLALAITLDLDLHQLDVIAAFLYRSLYAQIYMAVPEGLVVPKPDLVYLGRSIYGLKQSVRKWNEKFHFALLKIGFHC